LHEEPEHTTRNRKALIDKLTHDLEAMEVSEEGKKFKLQHDDKGDT
jgi:hypothetical protein